MQPSFDLLRHIRARSRRLKWLGVILCMDDSRMLHRVVMRQQAPYQSGSLLEGAPEHRSMIELKRMAQDEKSWSAMVSKFRKHNIIKYVIKSKLCMVRHNVRK